MEKYLFLDPLFAGGGVPMVKHKSSMNIGGSLCSFISLVPKEGTNVIFTPIKSRWICSRSRFHEGTNFGFHPKPESLNFSNQSTKKHKQNKTKIKNT